MSVHLLIWGGLHPRTEEVEEILRFEPTGHAIARYVARDVGLHGRTVPEGRALMFVVGAADRDRRHYPDVEVFDLRRKISQQLTFGLGGHYCLGAAPARPEGRIAMEEILRRFPNRDVDWGGAKLAQTSTVRGWETLPLVIG